MRRNKIVITNNGMVSNMVTTPKNVVTANLYEWLNGIVFKNETIITYFYVPPNKGLATYVIRQCVFFCLGRIIKLNPVSVQIIIHQRNMHFILSWRIEGLYFLKGNNRNTK